MANTNDFFGQYVVKEADDFMMLGVGQPSPDILKNSLQFINCNILNKDVLQYGLQQGFESFRILITKLMKKFTLTDICDKDIYMTNGVSQAVFMLASLFKNKLNYDTVYVEDLTYFIMINIFKDLGYKIKSFSLQNLNSLKIELKENPKSLVYLIPFCNNPTGLTMTHNQLQCFLDSIQKETIVLSDETYQFLHYNSYTQHNYNISNHSLAYYLPNILSLGTFSKILAPGVRLGWIYSTYKISEDQGLNNWLDNTGFMDSGGSVNPVMAYMITQNILNNYTDYEIFLKNTINNLEEKSNYVISVLEKYKDYFEIIKPNGGYFIFVRSKKIKSSELWKLATTQCKIGFHEGNKFSIDKSHDYWFRISVSYYSLDDYKAYFDERIKMLVNLIDSYQYPVSVFGDGKLGKLIKTNLTKLTKLTKLTNFSSIDRNFNKNDFGKIIVDVTSPEGTMILLDKINHYNIKPKLIIGTTGHTEEQINKIKEYAKSACVVYCANFSNGIQNLIKIIRNLTFKIKEIDIIDIHHIHKKDSPSGTAKLLSKELQTVYKDININIFSQREGEVIGNHKIILKGENETIIIEHDAKSRNIFANGCIDLINKIENKENGFYEYLE
jgi:DNA-binding transcriptional MocR family regulator/dihydrodipicolinate reductase